MLGGFSVVFEAQDVKTNKLYALKVNYLLKFFNNG